MASATVISPPTFGAKVRAARRAKELSQTVLGRAVGMSAAKICCIEKGYLAPSPQEQRRLAGALKLPLPRRGRR